MWFFRIQVIVKAETDEITQYCASPDDMTELPGPDLNTTLLLSWKLQKWLISIENNLICTWTSIYKALLLLKAKFLIMVIQIL